jgi:D-alanyl-D-alanine carboxypeptidase (penicillin-binding protein 5/6)
MKQIIYFLLISPFCIDLMAQSIMPEAPKIDSTSYILMEANTNKVIAEFNSDNQIPPASMTKIMTVYVIADQISLTPITLDDKVLISEKAWAKNVEGSKTSIEAGKKVSVKDLLSGIIIQSGNDASIAMAEYIGSGTEEGFVDLMNKYALKLGLADTLFVDSTGLSNNNFSSAKDLAKLTQALINDFPDYYEEFKERSFTFNNRKQFNTNKLLWRDDTVDGVKTGYTEAAGYCLVSSAKRNDMRLIAVVTGSSSDSRRISSSQNLLNYGFRYFATSKLIIKNSKIKSAKVWGGKSDSVALGSEEDIFLTLPRRDFKDLLINYKFKSNIQAPIQIGDNIGTMEFVSNDQVVLSSPLVAIEAVEAKGFFGRLWARLLFWISSLFSMNND